ncbi:hypothetical protein [Corynebacterium crudilactis]|uniref:Uncharacterized protein n=1 Tax=Corynebacterium crudilactis TaxID=1652495 RepID=A0A172QRH7_9CORY|nr:hypothetical protein [Corynebacterium crudilactis]ANE03278.1 hypothetical protein ccrud_02985 [Corynebacterium crudilactis]
MSDPLAGYGAAISALQATSRSVYRGPAKTEEFLRGIYQSIEGLNTGSLREAAKAAAGETNEARIQGWVGPLLKFFGTVGGGMIATELAQRAVDWFKNRNDAEEVSEAAGKAADTIDTTVDESDQGMVQIVQQLLDIVSTLTQVLAGIDQSKYPQEFRECVQAGSDLIDQAGEMIYSLCADRDEVISQCFSALTDHGKQVCEAEQKPLCSAASSESSGGTASSGGASSSTGGSGGATSSSSSSSSSASSDSWTSSETSEKQDKTKPAAAEETDCEENPKPAPEPKPEKCKPEPEPEDCEPTPEPEPKPEPEPEPAECEPEEPVECEPEETPEEPDVIGKLIKGAIGIGIVVVGVGLLVNFLEQCVPVIEEPPVPEPMPEPLPEPEPVPAPISEKPPEADLDKVPEPAPKPIPQANYTAAAATNYSAPVIAEVPAPVFDSSPSVNVQKAGGW